MDLNNKTIVITGASDGLGKQIALRLAPKNTKLVLIARNEDRLNDVCKKAKELDAFDAESYICDLSKTDKLNQIRKKL